MDSVWRHEAGLVERRLCTCVAGARMVAGRPPIDLYEEVWGYQDAKRNQTLRGRGQLEDHHFLIHFGAQGG